MAGSLAAAGILALTLPVPLRETDNMIDKISVLSPTGYGGGLGWRATTGRADSPCYSSRFWCCSPRSRFSRAMPWRRTLRLRRYRSCCWLLFMHFDRPESIS